MKKINVGDIVIVWGPGIRAMITGKRDEVVARQGMPIGTTHYKTHTLYQVTGHGLQHRWFKGEELEVWSERVP